eukprot:m.889049 g.889049  ORF g.889049 m.889049 type:complete len:148 (-) comp23642_c0_seq4:251-694(-)
MVCKLPACFRPSVCDALTRSPLRLPLIVQRLVLGGVAEPCVMCWSPAWSLYPQLVCDPNPYDFMTCRDFACNALTRASLRQGKPKNCMVNEDSLTSGSLYVGHMTHLAQLWSEPFLLQEYNVYRNGKAVYNQTAADIPDGQFDYESK